MRHIGFHSIATWALKPPHGALIRPGQRGPPGRWTHVSQPVAAEHQQLDPARYAACAVITGVHAIVFTADAEASRAFLRDTLGFPSVDAGGGWLIFALPPAELAAHPTDGEPPHHELYLMCDDINATVGELRAKGAEVADTITEQSWGLTTSLTLPGGGRLGLYQPKHASPLQPPG